MTSYELLSIVLDVIGVLISISILMVALFTFLDKRKK